MQRTNSRRRMWSKIRRSFHVTVIFALVSCTGQLPDSFRFQQQVEDFSTDDVEFNTKIDILWVVDNTPSMWPSQKKIRDGFLQFSDRYMKPNWDIKMAVITQDTYLAHPAFRGFLNGVGQTGSAQRYSRASGYTSSYLNPSGTADPKRTTPFITPASWVTTSINSSGSVVGGGVKLRHGIPEYGGADPTQDLSDTNPSLWARLLPGRHDGPLATICWTSQTNPFFHGNSKCHVRDQENLYSGVDNCVQGGNGDMDSTVQCVNTLMNNTVRTGKPIVSTKPPAGVPADNDWTTGLHRDFVVNLSGGLSGYPLEKPFNSIEQLIADNETAESTSRLFRPNALRVIIIVTDEDDQSTIFPSTQITPDAQYNFSGCPWKTVDNHTYRLQVCPHTDKILSVSQFKSNLDSFFRSLDGDTDGTTNPNYFVVAITPMTGSILKTLHDEMGENANSYGAVSSDYATRLFEFADLVGNGSMKLEITSSDYTELLEHLGQNIVQKKASFKLKFQPSTKEEMLVWIKNAAGQLTPVDYADFEVEGYYLTITNEALLLSLSDTDRLVIDYQPASLNQD